MLLILAALAVAAQALAPAAPPDPIGETGSAEPDRSRAGRVAGGTRCSDSRSTASLQHWAGDWQHFCGGAIIRPAWILTAAHCFSEYQDPETLRARLGSFVWHDGGELCLVSHLVRHAHYAYEGYPRNDIALLRLREPVSFDGRIRPLRLPDAGDAARAPELTVSGWGSADNWSWPLAPHLMCAKLKLVDRRDCRKDWVPPESQLCAFGRDKDSCSGDSGGPLYDSSAGVLVGIISYGKGCGNPEFPGIYTNVAYYIDWIDRAVSRADACPPSIVLCLVSLLRLLHFSHVR